MTLFFSRAPMIMDVTALGMAFIIPVLFYSIYLVRIRSQFHSHRNMQLMISVVLLFVILAFETFVRMYGWREEAKLSPYYETLVFPTLYIHIFFAVFTFIFWSFNIYISIKKSKKLPGLYSSFHKKLGWVSAVFMTFTSITGWIFYYIAFVSKIV